MSEPKIIKGAANDAPAAKEEGWWETVKVIVQALVIALVVRTLLFQPFNIPSGSLIPTLLIGDYLFVSKYSYGYSHYSLPSLIDLAPSAMPGRIFYSPPKRGDIVVFRPPGDPDEDFIKRRDRSARRQDPDDQGPALHQRNRGSPRSGAALRDVRPLHEALQGAALSTRRCPTRAASRTAFAMRSSSATATRARSPIPQSSKCRRTISS